MDKIRVFFLDNFDSFVYNLVDYFKDAGHQVSVYRNDVNAELIKAEMDANQCASVLVLSPGPGKPSDAGCMPELIRLCKHKYPIIGICLGHQAIVEHFGGSVEGGIEIFHGKSSLIKHDGQHMYADLPNPMRVARYHSLAASRLSDELIVNAEVDQLPMSVMHKDLKIAGFQFHPESILTSHGTTLLSNTLDWATAREN